MQNLNTRSDTFWILLSQNTLRSYQIGSVGWQYQENLNACSDNIHVFCRTNTLNAKPKYTVRHILDFAFVKHPKYMGVAKNPKYTTV